MGNLFCKEKTLDYINPSCDYCNNLPSEWIYVAKIYHRGKYNGIYICKTCLENKWKNK